MGFLRVCDIFINGFRKFSGGFSKFQNFANYQKRMPAESEVFLLLEVTALESLSITTHSFLALVPAAVSLCLPRRYGGYVGSRRGFGGGAKAP